MSTEISQVLAELKAALPNIAGLDTKFAALQRQVDALDADRQTVRTGFGGGGLELMTAFEGSEDLRALMGGRRKSAIIQVPNLMMGLKTTITTGAVGTATSGVLNYERLPNVATLAQRKNFMRDLLPMYPTTATAVDFVKEDAFTNAASMQVEASAKGESALTFTTGTASVRTIAHWIPASKQVLDDMPELLGIVSRKLIYGYLFKEDAQILIGSGTGNDLNGLVTQATAYNTALTGSGVWHKMDILRRAMQQVQIADEAGTAYFVLHPTDWADIELTKDVDRNYISGDPRSALAPSLWGIPVAVSTAMASGTFLAGATEAADLRVRQEITVEISTEHSDYFVKNMLAVRCEGRVALPVYRPGALITGTFTTSPA